MKAWIRKMPYVPGVFMFPKHTWVYFDGYCYHACKDFDQAIDLFSNKIVTTYRRGIQH